MSVENFIILVFGWVAARADDNRAVAS